jgi:hypothetical protein
MFDNSFINRVLYKSLWLLLLPACLLWSAFSALSQPAALPDLRAGSSEFATEWQGQPLRPLALSEVEDRFARRFPGTLSRLTNGTQVLVLRSVEQPTRMLHPATDCYQGLGYRIAAQQLERDHEQRLWRCFEAERGGQRLRVCERIVDAAGQGFTDTSAWYWAAVLGQSQGPWQAVTVASPL